MGIARSDDDLGYWEIKDGEVTDRVFSIKFGKRYEIYRTGSKRLGHEYVGCERTQDKALERCYLTLESPFMRLMFWLMG